MPTDFLQLLCSDAAGSADTADSIGSNDSADAAAADRVRTVLFECLFNHLCDERVASLFTILGFEDDFGCYAIAGYPARSAARSRKEIEKIVADFGGVCLTAERIIEESDRAADHAKTGHVTRDGHAVVALIRPVGAATAEVICNTISPSFDAKRPMALGPQSNGTEGAMHSIQNVLYCLKAAPALAATVQSLPRPLRTDDALPERALIGDEDARDELIRVVYGSLTAAGPDDPTLPTVSTFLKFGGSLESTAKELNVHPNTIRYRLKRAAETTGWDATDPREAYVLTTAIALGRIHSAQ
jgi:hypothetical protein